MIRMLAKNQKRQNLKLGDIEISNITQRKISIIGGTGSGKTTTLKLLAFNSPCPTYVIDPLNVITIDGYKKINVTRTRAED